MSTSAMPIAAAGAIEVPDPDVQNAYVPPITFTMGCDYLGLPSTCEARILPSQINAIVSEMIALSYAFDPNGDWNCASLQNMKINFGTWDAQNDAVLTNYGARITVLEGGGVSGMKIAYCFGILGIQSFSNFIQTEIKDWDTVQTPNGGITYDPATGDFTTTEDGIWSISGFINTLQQTTLLRLLVTVNGNIASINETQGEEDAPRSINVALDAPLASGSVIRFRTYMTNESGTGTFKLQSGRCCVVKIGKLTP